MGLGGVGDWACIGMQLRGSRGAEWGRLAIQNLGLGERRFCFFIFKAGCECHQDYGLGQLLDSTSS